MNYNLSSEKNGGQKMILHFFIFEERSRIVFKFSIFNFCSLFLVALFLVFELGYDAVSKFTILRWGSRWVTQNEICDILSLSLYWGNLFLCTIRTENQLVFWLFFPLPNHDPMTLNELSGHSKDYFGESIWIMIV